jgi:hypothetical protein
MRLASNKHQTWIWVVPLLLLTAWLGARGLDADPVKFDEYWSIYSAGGAHYGPLSASGILQRLAEEDPRQTPLFYLMLAEWGLFTGWTPAANRALSLFTGLLAVAWLYRLGKDIASSKVGLVAAFVVGASSFFSFYLHEIRGYTLYVLLTVICLWSYWRIVYKEKKPGFWVQGALFLSVAGLLHTLYLAAAVVISLGIYHLLFAPKNRRWWHTSLLLVAGAITFLPWSIVGLNAISRLNDIDSAFALDAGQVITGVLYNFSNVSVALLALVAAYSVFARGRGFGFVVFCAVSILILSLLINLRIPLIIHIRYLFPLLPLIGLIVGFGAEQLATRGLSVALILAIWVAAGVWSSLPIPSSDPRFDFMADKLAERGEEGDVLAFHGADFPWLQEPSLEYYMHGLDMDYVMMESLPGTEDGDTFEQAARDFIGDAPRVWLGINPSWPPNFRWDVFNQILDENYVSCGAVPGLPDDMKLKLDLYARAPDDLPLHFGEGINARLLESLPQPAQDTLPVLLGWSVDEAVPASNYSMALHLDDSSGQLVAQADFGLPQPGFTCQSLELPIEQLPPGTYTLLLTVYDWSTGERLPGENDATGEQGDRLALGTVTISP